MAEGRRPEEGDLDARRLQRRETRANQTYAAFLKDLCRQGGMAPELAEQAAVSVLCALEQRLMRTEAKDLEAQLPLKLQKLLVLCERHQHPTPARFGREEMLEMVAEDLNMKPAEVEPIIRAVFATLREHVSDGEIDDVIHQLPGDLRELWHPLH